MKGIVITTNNEISVRDFGLPLYKTVGEVVGGYIEHVVPRGLPEPFCMIVDEEGRLKNRPINAVGSYLYGAHYHGQPIVGDIVIMKDGYTPEGRDILGLEEDELSAMLKFFNNNFNLRGEEK